MTPEQYERVQEVFLRIRELPAVERTSTLAAEDVDIRREVESLLRSDSSCGDFLEHGVIDAGVTTEHRSPPPSVPESIGVYRILQQIGEGGHGSVFMAEQKEPIARKVAAKLIKPGMDSKQILARFHAEQQALAMMDHPSIARVIDAGTTETGSPYFVMELVRGVPIDQFCEENQLSLQERLDLFLQICRAVHHAHQKGIIHRDLKPSNVLVAMGESEPVAKVIDFGIAKALDTRLTQQTLFTEFGQMIGTLEYMSPEQAEMSAVDIDTRTDVYSLGVLLYQLLTGETPIGKEELLKKGMFEVPRLLRETEPPTPSSRVTARHKQLSRIDRSSPPPGLPNLPPSDLDWIVMKSLSKDRRRRYDSTLDFARDVERFIRGDAVEAHPPSLGYKLRKLAKRHRVAALAGFLIVTSALAGIIGLATGLRRAVVAERKARQSARELATTMYSNLLEAAWKATREHNDAKALRLLDACLPELRGWEWKFVRSQVRDSSHDVVRPPGGSPIRAIDIARPNGIAACVLENGRIEILNPANGRLLRTLTEFDANTSRFSPTGAFLAVGTSSGELVRFDSKTWKYDSKQLGFGGVYDIAMSSDGKRVAACTGGSWVAVFDLASLETVFEWRLPARAASISFAGSEQLVASGLDGNAYLLHVGDPEHSSAFVSEASLHGLEQLEDQTYAVLTAGRAVSIDFTQMDHEPNELLQCQGVTSALAVDRMKTVSVGCGDGSLVALVEGKQSVVANFGSAITALNTTVNDGELLVALSDGRLLRVADQDAADAWKAVSRAPITTGTLLPTSGLAISGDENGWLRTFDIESGEMLGETQAHKRAVWSVAANELESILVTVGDDQRLRCWELPDLSLRFDRAIDWGVRDVCLAPDGTWIAAAPPAGKQMGRREGTIAIWDGRSGEPIRLLEGHSNWVLAMAFTPDGSKLASSCENREIRIWDVAEGSEDAVISPEAASPAEHLAIDHDANRLFLGHRDGWVTSWSLQNGTRCAAWPAFGDAISGLKVTSDGRVLATSRSNGGMRVSNFELDQTLCEFDLGIGYLLDSLISHDDRFISVVDQSRQVSTWKAIELD